MKSVGIVRNVDEIGRIVIPVELRRVLDIKEKDPVEIYLDGKNIIIRSFQTSCVFCGSTKGITEFKDKFVCKDCIAKLSK